MAEGEGATEGVKRRGDKIIVEYFPETEFEQLRRRLAALLTSVESYYGVVFRSSEPTYATKDNLLTGQGSRKYGGRWNPPASFATVYAAISDATALAESKAHHLYYGLDPADALPRTMIAIDVKFAKLLDLTRGTVRKMMGISAARMSADDWRATNRRGRESLTQAIGRAAYECNLEGIVAPACDGGRNLVWFPGNLLKSSLAKIRNANMLG